MIIIIPNHFYNYCSILHWMLMFFTADAFLPLTRDSRGRMPKTLQLRSTAVPTRFLSATDPDDFGITATSNEATPAIDNAIVSMDTGITATPIQHAVDNMDSQEVVNVQLSENSNLQSQNSISMVSLVDHDYHTSAQTEHPDNEVSASSNVPDNSISMVSLVDHDYDISAPIELPDNEVSASSNVPDSLDSVFEDSAIDMPEASSFVVDSGIIQQLKNKIKDLEKKNSINVKHIEELKVQNAALEKKFVSASSELEKFKQIFAQEQIDMILGKIKRPKEWSDQAIQQGIEVRFFCHTTGYAFLRKIGFPFPSSASLTKRLTLFEIVPGVLMPSFKLLSIMLDNLGDDPGIRDAALAYDETKLNSALTYNPGTQKIDGYATLPPNFETKTKPPIATHTMVFMLARIKIRWKLPVAFFYTHNASFQADELIKQLEKIICTAKDMAQCNIRGFANDQGSCNQGEYFLKLFEYCLNSYTYQLRNLFFNILAVWKKLGIVLTRNVENPLKIENSFVLNDMVIYAFADFQHVLKNWRNALFNQWKNGFKFRISDAIFAMYAQPHGLISQDIGKRDF